MISIHEAIHLTQEHYQMTTTNTKMRFPQDVVDRFKHDGAPVGALDARQNLIDEIEMRLADEVNKVQLSGDYLLVNVYWATLLRDLPNVLFTTYINQGRYLWINK